MKYVVDMAKASADFDKCQERAKHLNFANTITLGAAAVCIAIMTVFSILRGPTGVFNALLIILGVLVIGSYVMTHLMKPLSMNAKFYKITRGGKLLGMSTEPCDKTFGRGEWVVVSVEDENGDVRKCTLGKVQKVENTHYTEPVLNLDHERLYIPYTVVQAAPEKVDAPEATEPVVETAQPVEEADTKEVAPENDAK